MLTQSLKSLFNRDLNKLRSEMESYQKEENIWLNDREISNSAGNLCLHIIGNLNWFIGAQLGHSGYIRQRELEFSTKNIPLGDLLKSIDETIVILDSILNNITPTQLEMEYPLLVFKEKTKTSFFLVHLTTHLSYHLGQINYHRQLLD